MQLVGDLREADLPSEVVCLHGGHVDTSGAVWILRSALRRNVIDWKRYRTCPLNAINALKLEAIRLLETRSMEHTSSVVRNVGNYLLALHAKKEFNNTVSLRSLLWYLERLRKRRREYHFIAVRRWYLASTDRLLDGFDDETAFALTELRICGPEQGVAVLSDDPDEGPFSALEEVALRSALARDTGPIQERVAMWLCLAYGRNTANLSLLREEDFITEEYGGNVPPSYFIMMPRIKKRQLTRADFKRLRVNRAIALLIMELIEVNRTIAPEVMGPRPLFRRSAPRDLGQGGAFGSYSFHKAPHQIKELINRWAERMAVISPRTGKLLGITARRMRYTFACKMVREGTPKRILALLLDHSDTQHVDVYYMADSRFVERLDAKLAVELGPFVHVFMGHAPIPSPQNSIDLVDVIPYRTLPDLGVCMAKFLCGLAPHRSCYGCSKFQPFSDGPHEVVLDELLAERDELLQDGNPRIAEQLDDTILAAGELVAKIRGASQSGDAV